MKIPFNKPFLTGKEAHYIYQAVYSGKISGNGELTQRCQAFMKNRLGCHKTLMTTSCTDALEMVAILLNIGPGDEVIVPSFTFVSTANAFVLRGAKIVFVDSEKGHPNLDAARLEELITEKTRAIVAVHYAGMACDMDVIMQIAEKHKIYVVEDAAQAIDSFYNGKPLGSIGHFATFSFHETKNIISGEGGMLCINDEQFAARSEVIWEKGTNRAAFFRGEVDKYGWIDVGASFLPSEVISAFLWAQLESIDNIQQRRLAIWARYKACFDALKPEGVMVSPIPPYATNNAHMFFIVFDQGQRRNDFIKYLKDRGIHAVFHYQSLHSSPYYTDKHDGRELKMSGYYSEGLVRLPLFYELSENDLDHITSTIEQFFG